MSGAVWDGCDFGVYVVCMFRDMHGMCFHSGSNKMVEVGVVCQRLWALYIACSRAVARRYALCSNRAMDVPFQALGV
jgi:hypothetical protein